MMARKSTAKTDASVVMPILEPILGSRLAAAIIEHRDTIKEPITEYAAELQAREYLKTGNPVDAAEMQILRGWRAIKADWYFNEMRKQERSSRTARRNIADAARDYIFDSGDVVGFPARQH